LEITAATILPKQNIKNNDSSMYIVQNSYIIIQNSNENSIFFTDDRNLFKEQYLLMENVSEIHHSTLELACSSNHSNDENLEHKESCNMDIEEHKHESVTENLYNNNDNIFDVNHKSMEEIISLHSCNQSENDVIDACSNMINNSLEVPDDDDKYFNTDLDINSFVNGLTSLHLSKESLNSRNVLIPVHYNDMINDAKLSFNQLDNNNKSTLEDMTDKNKLSALSECVFKDMSTLQNVECVSSHYNDFANTSTFKMPVLEKTLNINQQTEMEENAIALLDSSFIKQDQLEEVRCLDLEPRSSNSSEESNSDIEFQPANANHNDIKVSYMFS
jgi:hypothetical protein